MKRLHMQTEQVLAVARQLADTAQEIEAQIGHLRQRVSAIPWEGPGHDDYIARMNQLASQIQRKAQEGVGLSNRVNHEVEEWLEADAGFADGYRAASGRVSFNQSTKEETEKNYKIPPTDVQDLAAYTMDGDGPPIRIIKVGENEYLVVLRGTEGGQGGHNWGSAVLTGLGLPGDYQRQVERAIMENVPPGAKINFSGHSQGGIVANNLADDQDILNRYSIGDVYTFGSPSSGMNGNNYHRFAAQGDPVPFLDRHAILPALYAGVVGSMLNGPLLGSVRGFDKLMTTAAASAGQQTAIAGTGDHFSSHGVYSTSPELENMPLSYKQWNTSWNTAHDGQYQFGTVAESSLSLVEADLTSNDPLKIIKGAFRAPGEFGKTLIVGVTNNTVTPFTDILPKPLRNPVDGFLDRVNEFVMTEDVL
jgi:uncharacterized protein YukE